MILAAVYPWIRHFLQRGDGLMISDSGVRDVLHPPHGLYLQCTDKNQTFSHMRQPRCRCPMVFPRAKTNSEIRIKPLSVSAAWIDSQVFEGAEISVAD